MGHGAYSFKREREGSMVKLLYVHDSVINVVVHCIDVYAEHRIFWVYVKIDCKGIISIT